MSLPRPPRYFFDPVVPRLFPKFASSIYPFLLSTLHTVHSIFGEFVRVLVPLIFTYKAPSFFDFKKHSFMLVINKRIFVFVLQNLVWQVQVILKAFHPMSFLINNLIIDLSLRIFDLNPAKAWQFLLMKFLPSLSSYPLAISVVINFLFDYHSRWVLFPLFNVIEVLVVPELIEARSKQNHINYICFVLQVIGILLCLSLPVIMLSVINLAPLFSGDKLASFWLLPLAVLDMISVSILLKIVVPAVILILAVLLPVFPPNYAILVFTFFEAYEVLRIRLVLWLLAHVFEYCLFLIQIVQLEESLPNLSFYYVVLRTVRPLDVPILKLCWERAPLVLASVVLNLYLEDCLVILCQVALHPMDPRVSMQVAPKTQNVVAFEFFC